MSAFTLAISCLTTFKFALIHGPNIPGSYAILLFTASDLASIISHIHSWYCFCFVSILSFFLELFLHWSPVAYWARTDLGSSSFSILSFCLFILSLGFSRLEYQSGLPTRTFRTNTQKRCLFHYRGLECKSRKPRNTSCNRQIWPWIMEWSRAKANRVLPGGRTSHSKYPLPEQKRRLYTWTLPDGQHWNQVDYILCSQRWRSSI